MNFPREVFIDFYYGDILKIIGIGGLLARNRPTVLMLSAKAFAQMGLLRPNGAAVINHQPVFITLGGVIRKAKAFSCSNFSYWRRS